MSDSTPTGADAVRVEVSDGVAQVSFARPQRLNAVDYGTLEAFGDAVSEVSRRDDVRAVIIRGDGPSFCVGADMRAAMEGTYKVTPQQTMEVSDRAVLAVVESPVPVICALRGNAVGVGASLALATDLTVMADDAKLKFPFINLGLMPDGGATQMLPARLGRQRAAKILLLGGDIAAKQALDDGLVVDVVPTDRVDDAARELAAAVAARPANAVAHTREALSGAFAGEIKAALTIEGRGQASLLTGPEFAAAAAALAGKSKA